MKMKAIEIANKEIFSAIEAKKKRNEFWFPEIPLEMPISAESTIMEIEKVYENGFTPILTLDMK